MKKTLSGGFMTPSLLRQLWTLVDATQSHILLKLDDASLVQWLLKQLDVQLALNAQETHLLKDYIHSRLSLIRDLAQDRQSLWQTGS
jgi:hypothetical protein